MIKPNEYDINENILTKHLLQNGFCDRGDYYYMKKELYKGYVYLYLFINKSDLHMDVKVNDNDGYPYTPFYNPDVRHNNLVYIEVANKYNGFMDSLVKKNILKRKRNLKDSVISDDNKIIKIKYHADIKPLRMTDNGDWIDLRVAEDIFIPVNEYRLVSLGVSMKLPDNYEAHIAPRSSTFKNFGIIQTNSIGIIDNSYSGTNDIWKFPALCLDGKDTVNGRLGTMLHKNDRICQFRIMKRQKPIVFETVDKLDTENRGGFGSTGIK